MPRLSAALLALLAATAVGCGASNTSSQDFSGEEEDVAEVVEELQTAAQQDKPTQICTEILSTALSHRLGANCTETIETAIDDSDVFELSPQSVRIDGDRARVRVETGRDGERTELVELVNERRGGWRVDRFGGAVE